MSLRENEIYGKAAEYFQISPITIKNLIEYLNLYETAQIHIDFSEFSVEYSDYTWEKAEQRFMRLVQSAKEHNPNLKHVIENNDSHNNRTTEHIFAVIPISSIVTYADGKYIPDSWSIIIATRHKAIKDFPLNISNEPVKWLGTITYHFSQSDKLLTSDNHDLTNDTSLSLIHFEIDSKPITFFIRPASVDIGGISFADNSFLQPPKSAILGA